MHFNITTPFVLWFVVLIFQCYLLTEKGGKRNTYELLSTCRCAYPPWIQGCDLKKKLISRGCLVFLLSITRRCAHIHYYTPLPCRDVRSLEMRTHTILFSSYSNNINDLTTIDLDGCKKRVSKNWGKLLCVRDDHWMYRDHIMNWVR